MKVPASKTINAKKIWCFLFFLAVVLSIVVANLADARANAVHHTRSLEKNHEWLWFGKPHMNSIIIKKQFRESVLSEGSLELRSLYLGSFSEQERINIDQSIEYLEDRLNDAFNSNLLNCIGEYAVRGHNSGMSFFGNYEGTPVEPYIEQIRQMPVRERGLGILALQFSLLFLGEDGFQNEIPRLNIYRFYEDNNVRGRAYSGTVSLGYADSGIAYWQGAFTVGLNEKFFTREDYDVEAMAGTIFHEMLHNLGHRHPSTGDWDTDYAGLLIKGAGLCIEDSN